MTPNSALVEEIRARGRSAGQGACACPGLPTYADCRCEWSALIADAIQQAYRATPQERLARGDERAARWRAVLHAARMGALVEIIGQGFARGGLSALASSLGVSPPAISRLVGDARKAGLLP